jgi:hypothetical protein
MAQVFSSMSVQRIMSGRMTFQVVGTSRRARSLSITHIYIVHFSASVIELVEKQGFIVVSWIGTVLAL